LSAAMRIEEELAQERTPEPSPGHLGDDDAGGRWWAGGIPVLGAMEAAVLLGTADAATSDIMDPHSLRTVRLVFLMGVLALLASALAAALAYAWWTASPADKAVARGHAEACVYRAAREAKQRHKKKE